MASRNPAHVMVAGFLKSSIISLQDCNSDTAETSSRCCYHQTKIIAEKLKFKQCIEVQLRMMSGQLILCSKFYTSSISGSKQHHRPWDLRASDSVWQPRERDLLRSYSGYWGSQ